MAESFEDQNRPAPTRPVGPTPKPPVTPWVMPPAKAVAPWSAVPWLLLALFVGFYAYEHRAAVLPGKPTPPQATPLGRALKDHYRAGPANAVAVGDRVGRGEIRTEAAVVAAFKADGEAAVNALKATVATRCDKDGNITDPAGLAADLKRAGEFAGAE